jgi:hypothetical protein
MNTFKAKVQNAAMNQGDKASSSIPQQPIKKVCYPNFCQFSLQNFMVFAVEGWRCLHGSLRGGRQVVPSHHRDYG